MEVMNLINSQLAIMTRLGVRGQGETAIVI